MCRYAHHVPTINFRPNFKSLSIGYCHQMAMKRVMSTLLRNLTALINDSVTCWGLSISQLSYS